MPKWLCHDGSLNISSLSQLCVLKCTLSLPGMSSQCLWVEFNHPFWCNSLASSSIRFSYPSSCLKWPKCIFKKSALAFVSIFCYYSLGSFSLSFLYITSMKDRLYCALFHPSGLAHRQCQANSKYRLKIWWMNILY